MRNVSRTANLHGVVASSRAGIVIDVDIGAAFDRKVDPEPVRVSGKMLRARLSDNNTRRRYRRADIAQLFPLLADAAFDRIGCAGRLQR